MQYFITGGAGFIGSHLADTLLSEGHSVVGLDDLSTGSLDNVAHLEKNPAFRIVVDTVLNERIVDKYAEQSDVIVHLAAAVGVKLIIQEPLRSLRTNIRGSEIVLEAAQRYRKKVLVASTSEIYGKNLEGPFSEDADRVLGSPLKSRWSYSTSKAVDEILAYAYWRQMQLPTVIVRLFNTVGPRQTGAYGMVIPRFIEQALQNKPITVYGSGEQTRCFCHVADVVGALKALTLSDEAVGQVFNVGSQEEVSITQLAQRIIERCGSSSEISYTPYEEAYEEGFEDMQRRVPDLTKIHRLTGFAPRYCLDEIIDMVIDEKREEKTDEPAVY